MVTVSAPGKVHLMGEHAVVYGKPAFLAAVNLRLFVTIEKGEEGISIHTPEGETFIRQAVEITQKELDLPSLPAMNITVSSTLPIGYHLGSSAAMAVAVVGAVMYVTKKLWNPERINQIAYEVEKKQHGNPSGGDNTTVTFGGFIWFRKELEFLKSIWKFPFAYPEELNHFFLINTGRPEESTGEMVASVAASVKLHASAMEQVFQENEKQTKRIATAIKEKNEEQLMAAVKEGEHTLEQMGVVSTAVIPLIRKIETHGGVAKILGGGGKKGPVGFLLCYHKQPRDIEQLLSPYGYSIQKIELGGEGVRLEKQ